MGQANAARDKLYDLRLCNLSGKDATGFDLSGVIMSQTDVSKAKFTEAYFSKGYLRGKDFEMTKEVHALLPCKCFLLTLPLMFPSHRFKL